MININVIIHSLFFSHCFSSKFAQEITYRDQIHNNINDPSFRSSKGKELDRDNCNLHLAPISGQTFSCPVTFVRTNSYTHTDNYTYNCTLMKLLTPRYMLFWLFLFFFEYSRALSYIDKWCNTNNFITNYPLSSVWKYETIQIHITYTHIYIQYKYNRYTGFRCI